MCAIVRLMLIPVLAALALAVPAEAGTIVVKLTFLPGKLAVTSAPATVSGTRAVPLTVAHGRGSGDGWTVEVRSSKPVRVTGITARCAAGSTCTLPRAAAGASGNVVLHARRDSGMGVMNLVVTLAADSGSTRVWFTVG